VVQNYIETIPRGGRQAIGHFGRIVGWRHAQRAAAVKRERAQREVQRQGRVKIEAGAVVQPRYQNAVLFVITSQPAHRLAIGIVMPGLVEAVVSPVGNFSAVGVQWRKPKVGANDTGGQQSRGGPKPARYGVNGVCSRHHHHGKNNRLNRLYPINCT